MRFRRFAWGVLGVNLFVILWGAFVRASGSGAGCGKHWPLCNGEVLPTAPGTKTLIELTHRTTSGVALLLVAVLWWWSRREFPAGHRARKWALAALIFIVVEALIGAGLVLLGLVAGNTSGARAVYLAGHLANTFLLLGSLALAAHWSVAGGERASPAGGPAAWLLAAGLVLLLLVGMSGAVAALGDTLFPAASLGEGLRADSAPGSHALIRLRVLHPMIALFSAGYLGVMLWLVVRLRPAAREAPAARAIVTLLLLQLGLGASNLLLLAPTALQLGHLLVADLLWIGTVVFTASALSAAPRQEAAAREDPVRAPAR